MSTLTYILLFTFIGSIGALIGGVLLISHKKFALKISHYLASFAGGVLLGTAFFDLLPEALHEGEKYNVDIFAYTLFGIVFFFLIERFIHWFHHHEKHHEHDREIKSTVPLIVLSDTIHNFLDGVVIAATFLVSIPLGIATALAVFAHEVPQEIGDFGLLLHKGMSRTKVIVVNVFGALVSFIGAIISYQLGEKIEGYIPIFLALTAGFFIYIASSDLIPEIHYERDRKKAIIKSVLFILGIVVLWGAITFLPHEGQ